MLSKRYKSTEVDRRTWLHVSSGTPWSIRGDTHRVVNIQKETSSKIYTPFSIGFNLILTICAFRVLAPRKWSLLHIEHVGTKNATNKKVRKCWKNITLALSNSIIRKKHNWRFCNVIQVNLEKHFENMIPLFIFSLIVIL